MRSCASLEVGSHLRREPPQARAVHLQHRRLVRNRKRQLDVGEQEDRLGLDAGLAKQPAPFVPDGGRVRSCGSTAPASYGSAATEAITP